MLHTHNTFSNPLLSCNGHEMSKAKHYKYSLLQIAEKKGTICHCSVISVLIQFVTNSRKEGNHLLLFCDQCFHTICYKQQKRSTPVVTLL